MEGEGSGVGRGKQWCGEGKQWDGEGCAGMGGRHWDGKGRQWDGEEGGTGVEGEGTGMVREGTGMQRGERGWRGVCWDGGEARKAADVGWVPKGRRCPAPALGSCRAAAARQAPRAGAKEGLGYPS